MKHLMKIQGELKVPKGQYNNFGKYKYRSMEDILEAAKPIVHKHGCVLTLSDELVNIGERYYVKAVATLRTPDDTFTVTAYAREEETKKGMDGSQITGTASSYARKYALNGLFNIDDTKDADTNAYREQMDNAPGASSTTDDFATIRKLAKQKGILEENICQQGGVKNLEDMKPAQVKQCIRWLEGMK